MEKQLMRERLNKTTTNSASLHLKSLSRSSYDESHLQFKGAKIGIENISVD